MEVGKVAYMNASQLAGFFELKITNIKGSNRVYLQKLSKSEKLYVWKNQEPTSIADVDSDISFIKRRKDETYKVVIKEYKDYGDTTYRVNFKIWLNNNDFKDDVNLYIGSCEKDKCIFKIISDIYKDIPTPEKNEATKIILEETKNRLFPKLPNNLMKIFYNAYLKYSVASVKYLWNDYIKHNSNDYDETYFALIATKAINETIDWEYINNELKKYMNE